MAGDVFTVDTKAFAQANESLKSMQGSTEKVRKGMGDVVSALQLLSKTQQEISKSAIVDPNASKVVADLRKQLEAVGVQARTIAIASNKEVINYRQLGIMDKLRVMMLSAQSDKKKRMVMYGGQMIELAAKENSLLKASASLWNKSKQSITGAVRGVTSYATSMTGVTLSLTGIIALLLDIYNKSNRIGAMSRQITAQWGSTNTGMKTASRAMADLRSSFYMTVDAAGNIATSIARSGFEEKNLATIAKDAAAIELQHGIAVQDHAQQVKNLATSYGMTADSSSMLLHFVRETSKTVPYLSMQEVSQDMAELIHSTRAFNSDLLGTISMYNTLARQDIAEKLGLGKMPIDMRRDMIKTAAAFSQNLNKGLQATLGEGRTAAERILSFRKMETPEQFSKMAGFITKSTAGFKGAEKELATMQLLEEFGFNQDEMNATLAEAFAGGGFEPENLQAVMDEIAASRKVAEDAQKNEKTARAKLYKDAGRIAYGLESLEDKLKRAIENSMLGAAGWKDIQANLEKIASWALENIPKLFRDAVDLLSNILDVLDFDKHDKNIAEGKKTIAGTMVSEGFGATAKQALGQFKRIETQLVGIGPKGPVAMTNLQSLIQDIRLDPKSVEDMANSLKDVIPEIARMRIGEKRGLITNVALSQLATTGVGSHAQELGVPQASELETFVIALARGEMATANKILRAQLREKANIREQVTQLRSAYAKHQSGMNFWTTSPTEAAELAVAEFKGKM
ncbi:MAG: hypothetical protein WC444_05130 [Candidatus Paceibacterota bacterium]